MVTFARPEIASEQAEEARREIAVIEGDIGILQTEIERAGPQAEYRREGLQMAVNHLGKALANQQQILPVIEAGYEEIHLQPHNGWGHGWVEDPRPYPSIWRTFRNWLGIPIAVAGGLATTEVILHSDSLGFILAGFAFTILAELLAVVVTSILLGEKNLASLRKASMAEYSWERVLFLRTTPPEAVMEAYRKAVQSGLFEQVRVTAPQEMFYSTRAAVDPIIYGVVGSRNFLVVQYNLAEDFSLTPD